MCVCVFVYQSVSRLCVWELLDLLQWLGPGDPGAGLSFDVCEVEARPQQEAAGATLPVKRTLSCGAAKVCLD